MTSYFAVIPFDCFRAGVSISRKRHSRQLEAQSMRRHVLSLDDLRSETQARCKCRLKRNSAANRIY
jgi:hypothetical protein